MSFLAKEKKRVKVALAAGELKIFSAYLSSGACNMFLNAWDQKSCQIWNSKAFKNLFILHKRIRKFCCLKLVDI
jgi:hypothetical protein